MKRIAYFFISLIIIFIGLTFAVQNKQKVVLNYYFDWSWTAPLSIIVVMSFIIGVACGYVVNLNIQRRMRRNATRARKQVRAVEQELVNLRSLPIKDAI